jgi:hypothetical protein
MSERAGVFSYRRKEAGSVYPMALKQFLGERLSSDSDRDIPSELWRCITSTLVVRIWTLSLHNCVVRILSILSYEGSLEPAPVEIAFRLRPWPHGRGPRVGSFSLSSEPMAGE